MAGNAPNHGADELLGPYRLRRLIGRGASEVWEAEDERDARVVALKLFEPPASGALELRLRRVASSMRGWDHPHVVRINGTGDVDGVAFIDMPLIDGPSLGDILVSASPPSLTRAVAIVAQVASALDAAHSNGLVHCDVTPQRILITPDDFAHLSGFGLAEPHVTGVEREYDEFVAPERRTDEEVTRRADVFALARVLLECVRASDRASDPPPGLTEVIARGMAADPTMRYPTAGEFATAVLAVAGGSDVTPAQAPAEAHRIVTPERALPFHDDVQFTVYRPRAVVPLRWTPLLAFAHLGAAPLGTDPRDDPIQQVQARAQAVLGDRIASFAQVSQDSSVGLPEESDLTFELDIPGFDIKGPIRTFSWVNAVHMEEFQIRAPIGTPDGMARGRLLVMHGSILLAEVRLAIRVSSEGPPVGQLSETPTTATPFRKIFPSYSHIDTPIVMQFERYMESLGDRYLRDVYTLRAGEQWGPRLCALIREADVFQLFWSHNAMASRFVADEWQYALSLHRPDFIRPTYWEQPMPTAPGLPPQDLGRLHFHPLGTGVATHGDAGGVPSPALGASPPVPSAPPGFSPGVSPPPTSYQSGAAYPSPSSPYPTAPAPDHRSSRRNRWLPTGLAAVAVAAVAGVVGVGGMGGGVTSSPPIATTASATSHAPSTMSPTRATRTTLTSLPSPTSDAMSRLMALVPKGYPTSACQEVSPAADEALATVDCARSAQPGGPTAARFSLYPDAATVNRHFEATIGEASEVSPCPGSTKASATDWHYNSAPNEVAGRVACGRYQGRADIAWTQSKDALLGDAQSDDLAALHAWWLKFG